MTGVTANLVNPLTWMFWLGTGTPMITRAQHLDGPAGAILFILIWFTTASGLEAIIAFAVARAHRGIGNRGQSAFTWLSAFFFAALAVIMLVRNIT